MAILPIEPEIISFWEDEDQAPEEVSVIKNWVTKVSLTGHDAHVSWSPVYISGKVIKYLLYYRDSSNSIYQEGFLTTDSYTNFYNCDRPESNIATPPPGITRFIRVLAYYEEGGVMYKSYLSSHVFRIIGYKAPEGFNFTYIEDLVDEGKYGKFIYTKPKYYNDIAPTLYCHYNNKAGVEQIKKMEIDEDGTVHTDELLEDTLYTFSFTDAIKRNYELISGHTFKIKPRIIKFYADDLTTSQSSLKSQSLDYIKKGTLNFKVNKPGTIKLYSYITTKAAGIKEFLITDTLKIIKTEEVGGYSYKGKYTIDLTKLAIGLNYSDRYSFKAIFIDENNIISEKQYYCNLSSIDDATTSYSPIFCIPPAPIQISVYNSLNTNLPLKDEIEDKSKIPHYSGKVITKLNGYDTNSILTVKTKNSLSSDFLNVASFPLTKISGIYELEAPPNLIQAELYDIVEIISSEIKGLPAFEKVYESRKSILPYIENFQIEKSFINPYSDTNTIQFSCFNYIRKTESTADVDFDKDSAFGLRLINESYSLNLNSKFNVNLDNTTFNFTLKTNERNGTGVIPFYNMSKNPLGFADFNNNYPVVLEFSITNIFGEKAIYITTFNLNFIEEPIPIVKMNSSETLALNSNKQYNVSLQLKVYNTRLFSGSIYSKIKRNNEYISNDTELYYSAQNSTPCSPLNPVLINATLNGYSTANFTTPIFEETNDLLYWYSYYNGKEVEQLSSFSTIRQGYPVFEIKDLKIKEIDNINKMIVSYQVIDKKIDDTITKATKIIYEYGGKEAYLNILSMKGDIIFDFEELNKLSQKDFYNLNFYIETTSNTNSIVRSRPLKTILYNLIPTLAPRKNSLGINARNFNPSSEELLVIKNYYDRKIIKFINEISGIQDTQIIIDSPIEGLKIGQLEGFYLNGGEW